jgi:hypothetical protein
MKVLTVTQTMEIAAHAEKLARDKFGAQVSVTIEASGSEPFRWVRYIPTASPLVVRALLILCVGLTAGSIAAEASYWAERIVIER